MQHEPDRQKTDIAGLYHRVASTYGQVGPNPFDYAGQQLVKYVGITGGKRVLDVATGRGANLFPASELVGPRGEVVGVDLAESMVEQTMEAIRQRGLQNATVMQMDAEQLAFDTASFDYVLCSFALFLFPHLEHALAEFLRVLRPGGRLGVTFAKNPDPLSIWYGERLTAYHQRYQFPLRAGGNNLQPAQLPALLTSAGFSNVQVFHEDVTFCMQVRRNGGMPDGHTALVTHWNTCQPRPWQRSKMRRWQDYRKLCSQKGCLNNGSLFTQKLSNPLEKLTVFH